MLCGEGYFSYGSHQATSCYDATDAAGKVESWGLILRPNPNPKFGGNFGKEHGRGANIVICMYGASATDFNGATNSNNYHHLS